MTYWGCWPAFGTKQLQATDPNGFKFEHLAGLYDKLIPSFWVFSPSDLDFFFTLCVSFRKVYILTSLSRFSHYIIHTWKKANEFLNISVWQHCLCEAISNKIANINSDICSPIYRLSTMLSIRAYRHRHRVVVTATGPSPLFLHLITCETQRLLQFKPSQEKNRSFWTSANEKQAYLKGEQQGRWLL